MVICLLLAIPIGLAFLAPGMPTRDCPNTLDAEIRREWIPFEGKVEMQATHSFPGDRWSTGDDFHNAEARYLRSLAARHNVPVGCAIVAMHQALKVAASETVRHTIAPCKPRPFYD